MHCSLRLPPTMSWIILLVYTVCTFVVRESLLLMFLITAHCVQEVWGEVCLSHEPKKTLLRTHIFSSGIEFEWGKNPLHHECFQLVHTVCTFVVRGSLLLMFPITALGIHEVWGEVWGDVWGDVWANENTEFNCYTHFLFWDRIWVG